MKTKQPLVSIPLIRLYFILFTVAILLLPFTFFLLPLYAQPPEKMSYQAVIRNASEQLVTNQSIGVRVQILQSSEVGDAVYIETHTRTTNANGLVTLEIGGGDIVLGSFTDINWNSGPYFLKTETDPAGGTSYSITVTTQLLSVPYALQAESVTIEADPVFAVSPASGITGSGITNWNTAFGWGNHLGLYRPVSWVPSWKEVTEKPTEFTPSRHSHSTSDITSGRLPVANGGTSATSFNSGEVLIGNGTDAITTLSRKGIDIRADFPPEAHSHAANDIKSGTLAVERGGTGISSYTAGSYIRVLNATTLEQLTSQKVLTDIGAAPKSHTHGNITNDGKIGTTSNRLVMTGTGGALTTIAGTAEGQMLYWNGSAWVNVEPGSTGQVLTFINGVPTWRGTEVGMNDVYNPATGKIWMDRNLGASQVAISSTDANSYGHLYQWGRGNDGHYVRTSGTTTTLSSSDVPGHGNFIISPASPNDWRSPQNDNLWPGGLNNPCPSGYRVPTEAELNAERLSWSSNNAAGAFASSLKMPLAGYRTTNGSLSGVGTYGFYWSSSINAAYSRSMNIDNSYVDILTKSRAQGGSVRCIKE